MLFIQYLQNNGEQVVLEAIDKPQIDLTSAKAVLAEGFKHEQYVTGLIHNIYDAAYSVKDFRTMQFLDWFVKEQGEEETNADNLVKNTNCSAEIRRACICWTMNLAHGYIPHRLWYFNYEPGEVICACHHVTAGEIEDAVKDGAASFKEVKS